MPLEVLDFTLVLFGSAAAGKRSEISAFPCMRVDLSRIKPVLA